MQRNNAETLLPVRVSRGYSASPEEVFDAWLAPEVMRRWLFASESGEIVRVESDPRVGGRFSILERRREGEIDHFGQYLEITRPWRLAFTLEVPKHFPGVTKVVIEVAKTKEGSTMTLLQTGVGPEVTEAPWREMLDRLGYVLSGHRTTGLTNLGRLN